MYQKIFKRGKATWLLLMLLMSWGGRASSLEFGYPEEVNPFHAAAKAIIIEAYQQLGIKVQFTIYPAERSLVLSNLGNIDGELVRISGLSTRYPNLIQIPVSHVQAEQMAFSLDPQINIDGWQSLRSYRVAFHRGYKAAEKATQGMNIYLTTTPRQAFEMLALKRVDVVVANRFTGANEIKALGFKGVYMVPPPLQKDALYHYVNLKHKNLVPKLTLALEQMRDSGRIEEIYQQYAIKPLNNNSHAIAQAHQ